MARKFDEGYDEDYYEDDYDPDAELANMFDEDTDPDEM